jgi:alpha-glucosidase/alpha-D-xyloside xylohydrolase
VTPITAAGRPARLDIRAAGESSVRITLRPLDFAPDFPIHPAVVARPYAAPVISLRTLTTPVRRTVGALGGEVRLNPLTVTVRTAGGAPIQALTFEPDGTVSFALDDAPVLGMGEGWPRSTRGQPWRQQPVQFDRRGELDTMEPRWQSDMYGSRNPVAMLLGTSGWALFVPAPWMQVDMRDAARGRLSPWQPPAEAATPQTARNQQQSLGKGVPPIDAIVPGLVDAFVFDAHDPAAAMRDYAAIIGPAVLPPRWALGYMQSHRTNRASRALPSLVEQWAVTGRRGWLASCRFGVLCGHQGRARWFRPRAHYVNPVPWFGFAIRPEVVRIRTGYDCSTADPSSCAGITESTARVLLGIELNERPGAIISAVVWGAMGLLSVLYGGGS